MQLDHSLIREMYNAGMTLQEIKTDLIKQHKSFNVVSIAQLRKICQNEIKEREGKGKAAAKNNPDLYESVTVFGRQAKIKKTKTDAGMPTEIIDKIQENTVLIETACSTCSLKPAPGRPCAWPASMCQLGHVKPLTYSPSALLEEIAELREKYKKVEASKTTASKGNTKAVKSIFEEDEEELKNLEELDELEDEISKAGGAMSAHERIGAALKAAKETDEHQFTEIDNFDADIDEIDDMLESVEMSMPSDFSDEEFGDDIDNIEIGSLNIDDYEEE